MKTWTGLGALFLAGLLAALPGPPALAQNFLRYGFENRESIWVRGAADAAFKEKDHRLSKEKAYEGNCSELIEVEAEQGNYIYYSCDLGRAPICDELNISLWLQSNRPGIQLLCRVVLPGERDPRNLDQPLTVLVKGDAYLLTGRWQSLALRQPVKRLREQQQLLRAQLQRDVNVDKAYIDRVVLNVYGGPGVTSVYTDELSAGPLDDVRSPQGVAAGGQAPPDGSAGRAVPGQTTGGGTLPVPPGGGPPLVPRPLGGRVATVQLQGNQLYVCGDEKNPGQKLFMRAIRHTGTPLDTLYQAGFNTVFLDESTPPGLIEEAVNQGFWIVPSLQPPDPRLAPGVLAGREAFGKKVAPFLKHEAVIGWNIGTQLRAEQFPLVSRTAGVFRTLDYDRPIVIDVSDGFKQYTHDTENIQMHRLMLGIHRWPLNTSLELTGYRDWLEDRSRLVGPGPYRWTWIQTHLPDTFTTVAYESGQPDSSKEAFGPQPEQIHLLAYTAIGAGYRGLGFWSDRYLADSTTGRDRLLALALLNQELQMLEPLLASVEEHQWIDTSSPNVKAAVLRCGDKGLLVIPMWLGNGAQYVPGQSSHAAVDVTVPHVPNGCQCWEVSPGALRSYPWQRVPGGVKVRLREFSITCPLVFTNDLGPNGLVVRFQDHQRRVGRLAAQWAHDQAQEELKKIEQVEAKLRQQGHEQPDENQLLAKSREYLESCDAHRRNQDWSAAYLDAQRALRPLRILMRAQWEDAVKELGTPVESPYAVSYFTLPRHWDFWKQAGSARVGANLLQGGTFEVPPDQVQEGWLRQDPPPLDAVVTSARRVVDEPEEGKQCLRLQVLPRDPLLVPATLERSFIAVHSQTVPLPPGSLVRISAQVRVPALLTGSADGALFYDSAGGEALAVRLHGPHKPPVTIGPDGNRKVGTVPKWKKVVLYRRVPASGSIHVTMALTGLGTVYFDDVRIEPLSPADGPAPNRIAVAVQPGL